VHCTPLLPLTLPVFLRVTISMGCLMELTGVVVLISLMAEMLNFFSGAYWPFAHLALGNAYSRLLHILLDCLSLLVSGTDACMLWIQAICQICGLRGIFLLVFVYFLNKDFS
jgi:hypothetical protein